MNKLKYLGVEFDEWTEGFDDDSNKTYWTNICPDCAAKYDQLEEDVDEEAGSFACWGN